MFGQKYDPEAAKAAKERKANDDGVPWIKRYPKKETQFRFRPLVEIDELVTYLEVWDNSIKRGWPISEELAETFVAEDHQDVKKKPLLPIVALKEDRSWAWACPWAVVDYLTAHHDLKGTITDTDFICVKSGTGLDTEYTVVVDEKVARDLSKYDKIDCEKVLSHAHQHAVDEGYTEGVAPGERRAESTPEPAPEPEPEADEPEPEKVREASTTTGGDQSEGLPDGWQDHTIGKLRKYARERGINPSGHTRQEIIDAIKGDDAL